MIKLTLTLAFLCLALYCITLAGSIGTTIAVFFAPLMQALHI